MGCTVKDCMAVMEAIAPRAMAESWDPVGLQIGDPEAEVRHIGVALDATPDVVACAVADGVDLLVVHHPLFFSPLQSVDLSSPIGALIADAVKNGLAIFAAHTNLDSVKGGLNDLLCRKIGVEGTRVLGKPKLQDEVVLFVRIPASLRDRVSGILKEEMLSDLSFLSEAFTKEPLMVFARCRVRAAAASSLVRRIRALSPDVFVDQEPAGVSPLAAGLGRKGRLPEKMSLRAFAEKTREALGLPFLRMVGDPAREVETVAVCTGSGGSLMDVVLASGADVFLTGDIKYHEAMTALDHGLTLLDAGHFGTEVIAVPLLVTEITRRLSEKKIKGVLVTETGKQTDPFQVI